MQISAEWNCNITITPATINSTAICYHTVQLVVVKYTKTNKSIQTRDSHPATSTRN